jgi:very-short-patch-repair endonuclease
MKLVLTLLLLLAVIAALALAALRKRSAAMDDAAWPFYAKKPLSHPEQVLYHRLVKALPDHIVLAQVQLSRALGVKRGANFHSWNNRINRMSFDFLVCAKDSTVLAAIELDDRTHESPSRVLADAKKDKATAAAGIPLLRWKVKAIPDDLAIREAIPKPAPKPAESPVATPAAVQMHA